MATKDFKSALGREKSFDGINISQTYNERIDVKSNEEKKRVSLYLPAALYDKVSMYSSLSRINLNQLIINILEEKITPDVMKNALERMQEDVRAYV